MERTTRYCFVRIFTISETRIKFYLPLLYEILLSIVCCGSGKFSVYMKIYKPVLVIHLLLSIICLSVGFFSFIRFGLFDQCDPERTSYGWSIHRDQSDLSGGLIVLGFIFLGIFIGLIEIGWTWDYIQFLRRKFLHTIQPTKIPEPYKVTKTTHYCLFRFTEYLLFILCLKFFFWTRFPIPRGIRLVAKLVFNFGCFSERQLVL